MTGSNIPLRHSLPSPQLFSTACKTEAAWNSFFLECFSQRQQFKANPYQMEHWHLQNSLDRRVHYSHSKASNWDTISYTPVIRSQVQRGLYLEASHTHTERIAPHKRPNLKLPTDTLPSQQGSFLSTSSKKEKEKRFSSLNLNVSKWDKI